MILKNILKYCEPTTRFLFLKYFWKILKKWLVLSWCEQKLKVFSTTFFKKKKKKTVSNWIGFKTFKSIRSISLRTRSGYFSEPDFFRFSYKTLNQFWKFKNYLEVNSLWPKSVRSFLCNWSFLFQLNLLWWCHKV